MNDFVDHHIKDDSRLILFYFIYGLLFLVLIGGLAWRQFIKREDYLAQEERQCMRRILQPAPRGEIFDREGHLLVGNRPVFSIALHLREIRHEFYREYLEQIREARNSGLKVNHEEVRSQARKAVIEHHLEKVNEILERAIAVNPREISKHFHQRLLLPMILEKDISVEDYARLTEQLSVESPIQVIVESARYYPYGSVASHVLGFVGTTQELQEEGIPGKHLRTFTYKGKVGKNGLEKSMNDHLEGTTGGEIWIVDPKGYQYQNVIKKIPEKGRALYTTLDIDLQMVAENALGDRSGAIVVLDVESGDVLAMVSKPDFDLNDLTPYIPQHIYNEIEERGAWLNRAIQGFYPPASPFKIITAIAALRYGIVSPDEKIYCDRGFLVGNRIFPEHNNIVFGDIDIKKAIEVSSNSYFIPVALQVGVKRLAKEACRFGLNKKTNIELPYEGSRMVVPNPIWKMNAQGESWWEGDTANMSIGQGYLLVTPLQMACFAASFARNETITRPTLILDPTRNRKIHAALPIGLRDEHYRSIKQGMIQCATSGGGKYTKVEGLASAFKTGTGQWHIDGKKATVPWCVGFTPVDKPKIAIAVMVEDPTGLQWGGSTAGPITQVVLKAFYAKYIQGS